MIMAHSTPESKPSPVDSKTYYGYLFEANKRPTPMMRDLLTGLGEYIIKNIGDTSIKVLTPPKMAEFYRKLGGNYDSVFLRPPGDSLSFIFSSIGCQHTLQPGPNDFLPPSIPALTLRGFVHWQSIETLLGPEEHVPYLQEALKEWEIRHPETGERFPKELPTSCLPEMADAEVEKWHRECSLRLWKEAQTPAASPNMDRRSGDRPRSYTGPPRTPEDLKYAYNHVRVPGGNSYSATSSPRTRPSKDKEDYFNSRPMPRQQKNAMPTTDGLRPARAERPRTAEARHGHRSSPENATYDEAGDRGRRRSVPKSYASSLDGEPLISTHSPRDKIRPHSGSFGSSAKEYARRHSHPRQGRPLSRCSSESGSSDEGETTSDTPPNPVRTKRRLVGSGLGSKNNSARNIPDLRYSAASPTHTPTGAPPRFSPAINTGFGVGGTRPGSYLGVGGGVPKSASKERAKERHYRVLSAENVDRAHGLHHKHSFSTSGGSRPNSRNGRYSDGREGKERGNGARFREIIHDHLPFRRHSDSPPSRERERMRHREANREDDLTPTERRRREEREKFRREDIPAMGHKERSSEEERVKRSSGEERKSRRERQLLEERRREEARVREMERERERERVERNGEGTRRKMFWKAGVESRR